MDTMEHLFEEVEVNGKLYCVDVTIAYDAGMVDNGIGPYEFWGARGTDVRMELEIDKWEIDSIDKIQDEHCNVMPEGTVTAKDIEHYLNTSEYGPKELEWLFEAIEDDAKR